MLTKLVPLILAAAALATPAFAGDRAQPVLNGIPAAQINSTPAGVAEVSPLKGDRGPNARYVAVSAPAKATAASGETAPAADKFHDAAR